MLQHLGKTGPLLLIWNFVFVLYQVGGGRILNFNTGVNMKCVSSCFFFLFCFVLFLAHDHPACSAEPDSWTALLYTSGPASLSPSKSCGSVIVCLQGTLISTHAPSPVR